MDGHLAEAVWRGALVPAVSGFALCVGIVLFAAWKPVPRPGPWVPLDRARTMRLVRRSARLTAVGYGAFIAIVLVFGEWLQDDALGIETAWWGGLFLLAAALPVLGALTWVYDRWGRRRPGPQPRIRASR